MQPCQPVAARWAGAYCCCSSRRSVQAMARPPPSPSQRASALQAAAGPERRFVVELPGSELAYFVLSERAAPGGPGPHCFLPPPGRCYSFCVPAAQSVAGRVQAARIAGQLQKRLAAAEPFGLPSPPGCSLLALLAYGPGEEAPLEKGFLVRAREPSAETERAFEDLLRLHLPAPAHLSVYEAAEGSSSAVWRGLWRLAAGGGKELLSRTRVVALEAPRLHPAAPHLLDSAVFTCRAAARRVLEECTSQIPEAKGILDLVDKCPTHPKKGEFPVIVLEGLDATGKTTVTESLKNSLNAVVLRSPPSCVSQWRKIFDDEPTLIRRAFYALTNYIVASEIAEESTKSPVIVDRYCHSTVAYAIATEISGKVQSLPPHHHKVYQWPKDLLRPDVVFLLTVNPEERIRRLQGRGLERTEEEAELEANCFFRQKVEESYRRMENPVCHLVDASLSREEVLKTILRLIHQHCSTL